MRRVAMLVELTVLVAIFVCGSDVEARKKYVMPQTGRLYRKLFKTPNADELSLVPFCYEDTRETPEPNTAVERSKMSWKNYTELLFGNGSACGGGGGNGNGTNQLATAVGVVWKLQLLQLLGLNENEKTIKLLLAAEKSWFDCRLSWTVDDDTPSSMSLQPSKLKKLDVFQPPLRLREAFDQNHMREAETDVTIAPTGHVTVSYEFSVESTCEISLDYYPFDVQTCFLTFESTLDASLVKLETGGNSGAENYTEISDYLLSRVISSNAWAVVIFPPTLVSRNACAKEDARARARACWYDATRYRLVIWRLPNHQLVDFLFPALLILLISAFVFLIPPGRGDKMVISLLILLTHYVMQLVIYDEVPKSKFPPQALCDYLLVCVTLMMTSCIYAALSAMIGGACWKIPCWLQDLVVHVGPLVMSDLIQVKPKTLSDNAHAYAHAHEHAHAHLHVHARVEPDGHELRTPNCEIEVNDAVENTSDKCESVAEAPIDNHHENTLATPDSGFCVQKPESLTWTALGALFDRLFFIGYLISCITVVVCYIVNCYYPMNGFKHIVMQNLSDTDLSIVCYQLSKQNVNYNFLDCSYLHHSNNSTD